MLGSYVKCQSELNPHNLLSRDFYQKRKEKDELQLNKERLNPQAKIKIHLPKMLIAKATGLIIKISPSLISQT